GIRRQELNEFEAGIRLCSDSEGLGLPIEVVGQHSNEVVVDPAGRDTVLRHHFDLGRGGVAVDVPLDGRVLDVGRRCTVRTASGKGNTDRAWYDERRPLYRVAHVHGVDAARIANPVDRYVGAVGDRTACTRGIDLRRRIARAGCDVTECGCADHEKN